jgi:hypothetical protein
MKNILQPTAWIVAIIFLSFFSCQEESQEIIETSTQEQITANTPLADSMARAAANDGSSDDFLDSSSCFNIALPVTITIGNTVITITDEEGLDDLEDLIDDFYDGDADIQFEFPITVVFGDYSDLVIENEQQLNDLITTCDFNYDDDYIECVDFQYPISFSIFNTSFVVIDTVVIQNDEQLYDFLSSLDDDDNAVVASLDYPVTLVYANGDTIEVFNNGELNQVFEAVDDDCNDSGEAVFCNEAALSQALVTCSWDMDIDDDGNNDDEDYDVLFLENGGVEAYDDNQLIGTGQWELTETTEGTQLNLSGFSGSLSFLNDAWLVSDCDDNDDDLDLYNGNFYIDLDQECEGDFSCDFQEVYSSLLDCKWEAYTNLLNDEVEYLVFDEQGNIFLHQNLNSSIGAYNFSVDGSEITLDLNFNNNLNILNGEWLLTDCDDDDDRDYYFSKGNDYLELDQYCGESNEAGFDCFEANEDDLTQCNDGTDGPYTFDLTVVFNDCVSNETIISYHQTYQDAENNTNPIANTSAYQITDDYQTIYVRVEIDNQYEVFDFDLHVENCDGNSDCSFDAVLDYLTTCEWDVDTFNGDDHLDIYELNFEAANELLIENTETEETTFGTWDLVSTESGIILSISQVAGADIQAINGDWNVDACSAIELQLSSGNNTLTLDSDCN